MKKTTLAIAAAMAAGTAAYGGNNLLVNGGFEDSPVGCCSGPCQSTYINNGSNIGGWVITGGSWSIDRLMHAPPEPCFPIPPLPNGGQVCIDLQGSVCCGCNNNAGLRQTVMLEAGVEYLFTAAVAMTTSDVLELSIGGYSWEFSGEGDLSTMMWETLAVSFVADGGATDVWIRAPEYLSGACPEGAITPLIDNLSLTVRQSDCDNNGISDADEIAAGVPDCNQNGIPDNCDYEGLYVTPQQAPFGAGNFLSHTFTDVDLATEDVSVMVEVRADLDSTAEFATLKVDGETIDVLWVVGGLNCPADAQVIEIVIPADEFNALAKDGELHVVLEASPLVSATECSSSLAKVTLQYATDFPDCNGNGLDDFCEIADGTLADCDGNAIPDSCDDAFPDCNANGLPDACDIAGGTLADCNGNGQPDSCEIASWSDLDCDEDGTLDVCQIASNPALDENADGLLDACSFALGDFDLDGQVGGSDLAVLLSLWGVKNPPIGDLTDDGIVGGADLSVLLGNWGPYQGVWGSIIEIAPDPAVIADPEWRGRIIATGRPWRVRHTKSGIEMLLVPPGTFVMGCSPSLDHPCATDGREEPVHQVTLTQAFYLGRYEVTQAQWTGVMGSNPSQFQNPSSEVPADQVPNRPVDKVSWNMIQGFELATGLRLPTEAEWEYACRAGTTMAFNIPPDGTDDDNLLSLLAWYSANSPGQSRPVGQKQANNLGLHDMHGNVWEWCEGWYGSGYYAESPAVDPPGPMSGSNRVLRGGSWYYSSINSRASTRGDGNPGHVFNHVGFRVARNP